MEIRFIFETLLGLLWLVTNTALFLLWQKLKEMERNIEHLEQELIAIRTNYRDRFDDVKQHVSTVQLKIIERISILETRLAITHGNKNE